LPAGRDSGLPKKHETACLILVKILSKTIASELCPQGRVNRWFLEKATGEKDEIRQ